MQKEVKKILVEILFRLFLVLPMSVSLGIVLFVSRRQSSRRPRSSVRLGVFFLDGPGFDGNHDDFPGHDEAAETDGDVEGKHGIEIVPNHDVHDIGGLPELARFLSPFDLSPLTLSIKIRPPEIKQKAPINSVGGRAGRYEVGGRT